MQKNFKKNLKNTFKKPLTFTLLNDIMYIEGKGETKKEIKKNLKKPLTSCKISDIMYIEGKTSYLLTKQN